MRGAGEPALPDFVPGPVHCLTEVEEDAVDGLPARVRVDAFELVAGLAVVRQPDGGRQVVRQVHEVVVASSAKVEDHVGRIVARAVSAYTVVRDGSRVIRFIGIGHWLPSVIEARARRIVEPVHYKTLRQMLQVFCVTYELVAEYKRLEITDETVYN